MMRRTMGLMTATMKLTTVTRPMRRDLEMMKRSMRAVMKYMGAVMKSLGAVMKLMTRAVINLKGLPLPTKMTRTMMTLRNTRRITRVMNEWIYIRRIGIGRSRKVPKFIGI